MDFRNQSIVVYAIWLVLCVEIVVAFFTGRYPSAFVAAVTLILSMAPAFLAARFRLQLPVSFVAVIVIFVFSTLFLGEVFDFYERYWWWDVVLHGGSAVTFGMIGFLFVLFLFEGDRYAAPPWALALIAFCFAVTIGAVWEIFEFAMDQIFGLNMQKSGLVDTMYDLIVDVIGAGIGAAFGYLYSKGWHRAGPAAMMDQFVRLNRRFFTKSTNDRKGRGPGGWGN